MDGLYKPTAEEIADRRVKLAATLRAFESALDTGVTVFVYAYLNMLARNPAGGIYQMLAHDTLQRLREAKMDMDRYCVLNRYAGGLRDELAQVDLVGQTLNYEVMAIGSATPMGKLLEACPVCGKACHIADYNEFLLAVHVERFNAWTGSSIFRSCKQYPDGRSTQYARD